MSKAPFPEHLDALKLFARNGAISAELPIARLKRFSDYLHAPSGDVSVRLEFGHDEQGRKLLSASLQVQVQLLCQRCLGPMSLDIETTLKLLVLDEDHKESIDGLEAVCMEDGNLDVPGLIEDELILCLPLAPLHEDNNCNRELNLYRTKGEEAQQRTNPFSVLASLKENSANNEDDNSKT